MRQSGIVALNRKQGRRLFSRITRRFFGVDGDTWVVNYINGQYNALMREGDDKLNHILILSPFWTPRGFKRTKETKVAGAKKRRS